MMCKYKARLAIFGQNCKINDYSPKSMNKSIVKRLTQLVESPLKKQNQGKPSEREFGITFAAVFLVICLARLYHVRDFYDYWWILDLSLASIFLFLTYFWVSPLRPLNNLWHRLGLVLSHITNPIVMGIVFFLTILPIGLFMRLFKKDLLKLKLKRKSPTYWQIRSVTAVKQQSMKNQF